MTKITFAISHPIQYMSPLFKILEEDEKIDCTVLYFTDHTIGGMDRQFGQKITWDIPLLEGYQYQFLKNYSPKPAVSGQFFGLINLGVISVLRKKSPDFLIIQGWGYLSNFITLIAAKLLGIRVLMRAESPQKQETGKSALMRSFKEKLFRYFCHRFLYIGQSNKDFYLAHGVKEDQLFFTPYSVDNQRFCQQYEQLKDQKKELREKYGLDKEAPVFLFAGKYISKKRPMDLIKAFHRLNHSEAQLIMVGEGALRSEMESYIKAHNLSRVTLTGFINQQEIAEYYTMADVFVLPSGYGETWGLVVNEAMNFELPLIVSDLVGCTDDLVCEGQNGFTFPCGEVEQLAEKMERMLSPNADLEQMGHLSGQIVKKYSFETIKKGIKQAIQ